MTTWKCPSCGWDNADKWDKCARCGVPRVMESDLLRLEPLNEEARELKAEIAQYRLSQYPKWEYFQVSSDKIGAIGGLNSLGAGGWELVAAASYQEGGGMFLGGVGSSSYTVKFMYLFKRPLLPISQDLQKRFERLLDAAPSNMLPALRARWGI